MKLQKGLPVETGNYACYLTNHDVPTVVRFWLKGNGWIANMHEPPLSRSMVVNAFVGPLPTRGQAEVEYVGALPMRENPSMEFDL